MKTTPRTIGFAVVIMSVASTLGAQSFSAGLRGSGSFPTGAFSETQTTAASTTAIEGAKSGFGYGLDVALALGPIGIYGSFDHIKFDCETATCKTDGKYTLSGVTAGVKLATPSVALFRPFVKAGVTFNNLSGGYGGQSSNALTTDKAPGYEVGVGADVSLLGLLSFSPQARYVGQNLKAKIPGVTTTAPLATSQAVNYFSFDLGLSVHTPFGGR